jgi:hypothetical protein
MSNDLAAEIEKALAHVQSLRSQRSRARNTYEAKLAANESNAAVGSARQRLDLLHARVMGAEQRLRTLRMHLAERQEFDMRHHDDEHFTGTPPRSGMVLRAFRTITIGSRRYSRGEEIDPAVLGQCLNADRLLQGGHVRWSMPGQAVPVSPRPAPPLAPSVERAAPPSVFDQVVAVMRPMIERNVGYIEAEDLVIARHGDLWTRFLKEEIDAEQLAMSGAWGAPGMMVKSGIGSSRRILDMQRIRARLHSALQSPSPQQAA